MYTQCPDCDHAFRVTALLLQQGAGRVVCNGCGTTFNALEKLSEGSPEATHDASRSMLESLDELTGPHEIRIEDTGVEWRVIDEDGIGDDEDLPADAGGENPGATGSVRWYIDDDLARELEALNDAATSGNGGRSSEAMVDEAELVPEKSVQAAQESLPLAVVADEGDAQRYDDNTPLPEDFEGPSEEDPPRRRAEDRLEARSPEADEAQVDLALGDADEWMELLGEVTTAGTVDAMGPVDEAEKIAPADFPADIDTQFDLQAIEMGIDTTGSRPELRLSHEKEDPLDEPSSSADEVPAGDADDGFPLVLETSEQDLATDGFPEAEPYAATGAAPPEQPPDDEEERLQELALEREHPAFEITLDRELQQAAEKPAPGGREAIPVGEHYVPPPTDEERTINLLIDQDLIRLAEEQDVFASTGSHGRRGDVPHVETIIMEGEFVRSALEAELQSQAKREATNEAGALQPAARSREQKPARAGEDTARADEDDAFLDTDVNTHDAVRLNHRDPRAHPYRLVAGVALLAVALAAQVVHAWRGSLATWPVFDRTVGSVYRLLGEPLHPDWNIRGWQFEATGGQTDDAGEVLTISSRVANKSDRPMPYPLLHVSLTDRFEEIIGSTIIEPREYLGSSADAAQRVPAGANFTAAVRLPAPSPEATGFKLNVCYREAAGLVRCAIEDFRD